MELHPLNNFCGADSREIERFLHYIVHSSETECWFWSGYRDPAGYGKFQRARKTPVGAHRFSYELSIGSIPEGFQVHHKCNNRACVNPNHLEALGIAEHVSKTVGHPKNQTHCIRGHEFTPENTRTYKGFRSCRTCIRIRLRQRYDENYQETGAFTNLYCINGHPLFGENMHLVLLPRRGYRRYCKACRREASERYRLENQEAVLIYKTLRRADRAAARKIKNRATIIDLRHIVRIVPADTLVLVLRRLLNDCD